MTEAATLWAGGEYERIARRLAPVQDALVAALGPRPGERWLDAATGTGEVALRAARAGAHVTGMDIAPRLLEQAREKARAAGLEVVFDEGDAEALPYADGEFDVVASNFGVVFAPDHEAVARELARVVRPGGRLGLTLHVPIPDIGELYARHGLVPPEGAATFDWGRDGYAERLLGDAFELEVRRETLFFEAENGEEIWNDWRRGAPPMKALVDSLDEGAEEALRRDYVAYCERFRDGARVRVPRPYLLALGIRR